MAEQQIKETKAAVQYERRDAVRETKVLLKPEILLMNAIFGKYQGHGDYYRTVDGVSLHDALMEVLESFQPKSKRVILLRFGFEDGRSHSLKDIGKELGLTGERIRQLEARTLRLLRHSSRSCKLKSFIAHIVA